MVNCEIVNCEWLMEIGRWVLALVECAYMGRYTGVVFIIHQVKERVTSNPIKTIL
jgi:hypothetical protein